MRRADRLFQIIQVLRRTRKPLTADAIAAELETSKRTIYRDIATLIGQRVPIRGEAGMGYILEKGFDLPPLMLTPDEIEAAVLGAQWVAGHADPVLSRAAAGPDCEDRRHRPGTAAALCARTRQPRPSAAGARSPTASTWRGRGRRFTKARKSALRYRDEHGRDSERTIWPIAIGYHEAVRLLAAWCELRRIFAVFGPTVSSTPIYLDEKYPERRDLLRARWRQEPGLGTAGAIPDRFPDANRHLADRRRSRAKPDAWRTAIRPSMSRARARPAAPAVRIRRTGRASPPRTTRRSI